MRKFVILLVLVVFAGSIAAQKAPVNEPPIDFSARDMSGKMVSIADLRGKVVVLNLWFINCPNCLEEIKLLNQLVKDYRNNKDVVFIAPAASPQRDLESFLKKNPFDYQVLPDSIMMILMKFGTPDKNGEINVPFPMHYVIGRDGKTLLKIQGQKGVAAVKDELAKQFSATKTPKNP